jgi:selenocysteine lyase/cysteine desulfurase
MSAVDGAHVPGMMELNVHDVGCDMYSASPHKWLQATKGSGFLYVRDEVIDRVWNTIATEGWEDAKIRAERFQRIGSSNVPALHGLRAALELANQIGMKRIEQRHRAQGDYLLQEMIRRGVQSWTSPHPALRCAIITVNVPPIKRADIENWLWKQHKIRIRGGDPSKLRLSTPYYVRRTDVDTFLEKYDQYRKQAGIA